MATEDRLEILSSPLLDDNRELVNELKQIVAQMRLEFGWHYLLDLVWIINNLDLERLEVALDAGAGEGVLQWYLASKGVDVISVDRDSRAFLPLHYRKFYQIEGLNPGDLASPVRTLFRFGGRVGSFSQKLREFGRDLVFWLQGTSHTANSGKVIFYHQDLRTLKNIASNTVDVVVAVSSLEHNDPDQLPVVVAELLRVLKPGGKLVATLSTTGDADLYHEPSSGWTYCEDSMRSYFGLEADTVSNYDQYPELLEGLKNSAELKEGLAKFYFQRGEGGMPWGVWDPQYVPIGVCKVKPVGI